MGRRAISSRNDAASARFVKRRVLFLLLPEVTYDSAVLLGGDQCATSDALRYGVQDPRVDRQKTTPEKS